MTEASHQMACMPLPPRPAKLGSVGLPAGPDIAIMDEAGKLLPRGAAGEVGDPWAERHQRIREQP